jgi:hypothetical protein
MPVITRETTSPSAEKLRFVLAVAVVVGVNRTVTVCVAPFAVSVKGLPETMLNGAATDAVPVTVPLRVLCTVNVCVAKLPTFTFPKFTLPVGVTEKSICAVALATTEHALWLPVASTAATATL